MPRRKVDINLSLNQGQGQAQRIFFNAPRVRAPSTKSGDQFLRALSGVTRELGTFAANRANERAAQDEEAGRAAAVDPEAYFNAVESGEIEAVDSPFFTKGFDDLRGSNMARDAAAQINADLPENATLDDVNQAYLEARREALEAPQGSEPRSRFFVSGFDGQLRGQLTNSIATQSSRIRSATQKQAQGEIDRAVQGHLRNIVTDPQGTQDMLNLEMLKDGTLGHSSDRLAEIVLERARQAIELTGSRKVHDSLAGVRFNDGTTLGDRHGLEMAQFLRRGETTTGALTASQEAQEARAVKRAAKAAKADLARKIASGEVTGPNEIDEETFQLIEQDDPAFRVNGVDNLFKGTAGGADLPVFSQIKSQARNGGISQAHLDGMLEAGLINIGQYDEALKLADAREAGEKTLTSEPTFKTLVAALTKVIEIPGAPSRSAARQGARSTAGIYEARLEVLAENLLYENLNSLGVTEPEDIEREGRKLVAGVNNVFRSEDPSQRITKDELAPLAVRLEAAIRLQPAALSFVRAADVGFGQATGEGAVLRRQLLTPEGQPLLAQWAQAQDIDIDTARWVLHMQLP